MAKISEFKEEAHTPGIKKVMHWLGNIFLFRKIYLLIKIKKDPISFLKDLDFPPIEEIIRQRFGCTEQCHLCGASCSNGFECDGTNRKHTTELHRTPGLSGWHQKNTKKLTFAICSSEVASDNSYHIPNRMEEGVYK